MQQKKLRETLMSLLPGEGKSWMPLLQQGALLLTLAVILNVLGSHQLTVGAVLVTFCLLAVLYVILGGLSALYNRVADEIRSRRR